MHEDGHHAMNHTEVKSKGPKTFLSRRKKIVFTLILAAFVFVCIDTPLFFFLKKLERSHNIFHEYIPINDRVIDAFSETYFHPTYGWDIPKAEQGDTGQRRSPGYRAGGPYRIKTFGDSFVYGFRLSERETFQHFVEEITIAGNLKDMFANLVATGNDLDYRSSILTGSWLLEEMTIAGD